MDGFRHWALRPVIDATCSGMDLGYQILEPSCDFLELLGFFSWGKKHISQIQPGKSRENRIDGPVRFEKMFAFLFFGVYFFLGENLGDLFLETLFEVILQCTYRNHLGKFPLIIKRPLLNAVCCYKREVLECHGCEWPMLGTSSEFRLRCISWGGYPSTSDQQLG